jgi:hypothetical protein
MDQSHIGFGLELQLGFEWLAVILVGIALGLNGSESHWDWVGTVIRVLNRSLALGLGWNCN